MRRCILVLLLSGIVAFAQTRKEFEVASIKPVTDAPPNAVAAGVRIDGSQVRMSFLSLKDYIGVAYRVRLHQISGPDWLGTQRFDIAAKLPDGSVQADVPEMLQSLLADRFGMKSHREKREFPVYALETAKAGFTLTPTGKSERPEGTPVNVAGGGNASGVEINFGDGAYIALKDGFEIKDLPMNIVADMLTRFLDRPVVDMTNLKGTYEFKLPLAPEDRMSMLIRSAVSAGVVLPPQALVFMDAGSHASLLDSLRKVGLTLESRKAPLDVLVVDEVQKTPTEN